VEVFAAFVVVEEVDDFVELELLEPQAARPTTAISTVDGSRIRREMFMGDFLGSGVA
jgi:hypothetical protein